MNGGKLFSVDRSAVQTNMNDFESQAPAAGGPSVISVSALNQAVSRVLERNFPLSWVSGEISNFTRAAAGHWYITLKDEKAQVRAVMFKGRAQFAGFTPREGDKVEVRALVTLYAPRGDYQLSVEAIRRAGLGNLYEAFLRLKEKLDAEGLFDPARKRPLPAFVRTVGVVTSLQAAALRDVLSALQRRAPHVRVVLYPTPVQGEGAALQIARAIDVASARAECQVLLVCRGGGSIEDLWSFNEEVVARAIAGCSMPVISGVGHETDFTIADFAADLRAPTPTAAAELAARPQAEWLRALEQRARALAQGQRRRLAELSQTIDWLGRRLQSPAQLLRHERLRLANLQARLTHANRSPLAQARFTLTHLHARMQAALPDCASHMRHLGQSAKRLNACMQAHQRQRRAHLQSLAAQLELLNPQRTLERGYAIVTDSRGHVLRSPAALKPRQAVVLRLAEGSAEVGIASVQQRLE